MFRFCSVLETAINIGYSCQLLSDEMVDLFIVDGTTREEVEQQLRQFRESVRIIKRFQPRRGVHRSPTRENNIPNGDVFSNSTSRESLNGDPYKSATSVLESNHTLSKVAPVDGAFTNIRPPAVSVVTFRWDIVLRNKHKPIR